MEIFGYECNYSFDPNKRKSNRNVLRGELITMVVSVRRGPRGGFFFRPDGGYWIAGRRNESDPRKMLYADLLFSAAVLFFFFTPPLLLALKESYPVKGGGHRFYYFSSGERISLNQ